MKKFIAFFAAVCLIAVSGCGNNNGNTDTTTGKAEETTASQASEEGGKKTEIAFEMDEPADDSDSALAYLEGVVPLFKKYLVKRRTMPLTFETTVKTDKGEYKTGIYVKDEENFAQYSKAPDGSETTVIYMKDTAYQITTADKVVYKFDCGEREVSAMSTSLRIARLDLDEVEDATYYNGTEEYEGKEYNKVAIVQEPAEEGAERSESIMYFDKDTDELAYSIVNGVVSKVDRFENTFTNEEKFTIPSDYEMRSYNEYLDQLEEQMKSAQAAQTTE